MPSQQYRGHLVDVVCTVASDGIGYRLEIRAAATGEVRHAEEVPPGPIPTVSAAHDQAFHGAREWIDQNPLHWPFPPPAQ
jgi:hypothetical protein